MHLRLARPGSCRKRAVGKGRLLVLAVALALWSVSFGSTSFQGEGPLEAPQEQPENPPPKNLTIGVIGDYGVCGTRSGFAFTCASEKAVAAVVHSWKPAAILTTGDNFYDSEPPERFRAALDPYKDDIASGRFFPVIGNHDWLTGTIQPLLRYFRLDSAVYERQFSSLLTAYFLDTNPEETWGDSAESRQARWLRAQLASSKTIWNVTLNHQPPYASCGHGSYPKYRWVAAPGVDVVFSGHNHSYERLVEPDAAGTAAIPYFVIGASGAALGLGCDTVLPGQRKAFYGEFGALRIDLSAATLTATFYNLNGIVRDSVVVRK